MELYKKMKSFEKEGKTFAQWLTNGKKLVIIRITHKKSRK